MIAVVNSTTGFSENVVVAETSYQVLEALSLCDLERVLPSSIKLTVLTLLVKKKNRSNEALRGDYVSSLREKKIKSNRVIVVGGLISNI